MTPRTTLATALFAVLSFAYVASHAQTLDVGMATIGHWKNGTMDHEWLFWDNQDFMNQLGLGAK